MFGNVSASDVLALLVVVGLTILTDQLLLGIVALLLLRIAVALSEINDSLQQAASETE
jgi:hypothetical protein